VQDKVNLLLLLFFDKSRVSFVKIYVIVSSHRHFFLEIDMFMGFHIFILWIIMLLDLTVL